MSTRHFDLIAFDWDGTLFDSTAIIVHSIQEAVRDLGYPAPTSEAAAWIIGMDLGRALAHAAPEVPLEKYPELSLRYRYHYLQHQDDLSLFDGILPMLHDLRQHGYRIAVATGKSRRGLDHVLRQVQLLGMFDSSRTADETAGKPHPLMLQELMEECEVPPERLLMVGDTTHDLAMARAADCPSVGVTWGAHNPADFTTYAPLYIAPTVAQLHQWLLRCSTL